MCKHLKDAVFVVLLQSSLCLLLNCLFFCLFFSSLQVIPPGGNTSFDVVFLARVVGNVENTLFINTSHHGVFTYQVQS